jgi:CheY-like chemotaxis protein
MTSLNGLSILVLEDDPDARELMHAVLEKKGARVLSAESVSRAFELLEETAPDVIVSDIAMPQEDGVEFILRLRSLPAERGGRIPAIAVSAFVTSAVRSRAISAGFERYLHKPVDFDKLVTSIRSLVGRTDQAIA